MSEASAWRGGRLDRARLAGGVLAYDIVVAGAWPPLGPRAFERIVAGLEGHFVVTRRASTSAAFEKGEGFERPSRNPFRSVDRGSLDLQSGEGRPDRLSVTLSLRSQLGFVTFGVVAAWLVGFHDSNPLWWALGWGTLCWWSVESVRRRVGRRLREWVEG